MHVICKNLPQRLLAQLVLCFFGRLVLLVESIKDAEVEQEALAPRQGLPDVILGVQLLPLPRRLQIRLVLGDGLRPEHVFDFWVGKELVYFLFSILKVLQQKLLGPAIELDILMVLVNRREQ